MTSARRLLLLAIAAVLTAAPASAQQPDTPPGPFALDIRFAMPSYNTGTPLADPVGFRTAQLPSRGWGFDAGIQGYPVRRGHFALGLGASLVHTKGSRAPDPDDTTAAKDPTVETRFNALVPALSLNFGTGRGWSYISGGFAFIQRVTADVEAQADLWPRLTGIHYGGGARWFLSKHVAFSFDLRFYRIPEQPPDDAATPRVPFQPKSRLFMGSAGLSFK